jgi:Family of unknown function (DUF6476)
VDTIPNLLKAFVIAGGIALIAGTALLVVLILVRGHGGQQVGGGQVARELPATLSLPKGARVQEVVADGSRWLLLGTAASGQQFLAVVDPHTGLRTSLLWLQPED